MRHVVFMSAVILTTPHPGHRHPGRIRNASAAKGRREEDINYAEEKCAIRGKGKLRVVPLSLRPSSEMRKKTAGKNWPREILG